MKWRAVAPAVGAIVATLVLLVGVPLGLVLLVGNPWPGRTRIELGDEVAIVVGLLAIAAWLLWARFLVAVGVELRVQIAELRRAAADQRAERVDVVVPPASRTGIGLLAQRLVAVALMIVPMAPRAHSAVADTPRMLPASAAGAVALLHEPSTIVPAPTPVMSATVIVREGDTLIGLARTHLGGPARWREIFELNRDRPQADGHRLLSPSGLRAGWRLELPPTPTTATTSPPPVSAAPASWAPATTLVVQPGDNLWELTEARLAGAGAPTDDATVAAHLQLVIGLNGDVVADPDLIYVGQELDFPQIGAPPMPAEPVSAPAVEALPATSVAPPPAPSSSPSPPPTTSPSTSSPSTIKASTTIPSTPSSSTSTTAPLAAAADAENGGEPASRDDEGSPSPIGIGEAALLSAGVLALVAARRRQRLRAARPRARVPEPPPGTVATERRLRAADAGERLLRVDVAVRAAAASLVDGSARVAVVCAGADGVVELALSGEAALPAPWRGAGRRWWLPGSTPIESLAPAARTVGAPCVALAQLGVDADGRDVLADLEGLGLLSVAAEPAVADSVVRGVAASLAASVFAEVANLIAVGLDDAVFLDHRHAHHAATLDEALELATSLIGTTASAQQTTFTLRARHTSGEAWEPAVVLAASAARAEVTADVVGAAGRRRSGLAIVVASDPPGAPWSLRCCPESGRWVLEPLGLPLTPVGLTRAEVDELHDVLVRADVALEGDPLDELADLVDIEPYPEPRWALLVRMLGPVEIVDAHGVAVRFERSKSAELIVWLSLHRERPTRTGARTALWDLDVRDATFANVVSEARRAMARHLEPPPGEEWLGRTLTEVLPLHHHVVADVDLVRDRLEHARRQPT